jgi:hypothetical protein
MQWSHSIQSRVRKGSRSKDGTTWKALKNSKEKWHPDLSRGLCVCSISHPGREPGASLPAILKSVLERALLLSCLEWDGGVIFGGMNSREQKLVKGVIKLHFMYR